MKKQFLLVLDDELIKKLKIKSIEMDTTMSEIVSDLIEKWLIKQGDKDGFLRNND